MCQKWWVQRAKESAGQGLQMKRQEDDLVFCRGKGQRPRSRGRKRTGGWREKKK